MMSTGICARCRCMRRSTSAEGKALLLASALMPMDSRNNIACEERGALGVSIGPHSPAKKAAYRILTE